MSTPDKQFPSGPRGEQGKTGEQGERGERGLSRRVARAIIALFLINALGIAGNLAWTAHETHSAQSAQQAERAASRRQAELLEQKLCTSLGRLAALSPPPGSPLDNPSRAYLQNQHAVLAELGPDVGCTGETRG